MTITTEHTEMGKFCHKSHRKNLNLSTNPHVLRETKINKSDLNNEKWSKINYWGNQYTELRITIRQMRSENDKSFAAKQNIQSHLHLGRKQLITLDWS